MASVGRAFDSITKASESSDESRLNPTGRPKLIRDSIERLHSWMAFYVKSQLGCSASANDFTERIERRLLTRPNKEECGAMDDAVRNTLRLLIHEDRRLDFRRAQLCTSGAAIEKIGDPGSLEFAARVERESQIQFIRERIPADMQAVVDSLYGFAAEETLTVADLAKRLGIRRNTLDQRLHRLFARLRSELK